MASVVEKDDTTVLDPLCNLSFDLCGWWGIPVVSCDIPHDRLQAEFADYAQNGGPAPAERRAEQVRGFADGIFKGGAALYDFAFDFGFAFEDQQRMGVRMIANDVAGLDNFTGQARVLLDVASD